MAMSLNKAQIIGNLTRDPEMRQIPGGQIVTTFSVATNFTWNDQNGQRQEKVEFHNVVAWRKLGEICGQYLKKGSKIFLEGRIQTRSWEAEDGSKKYRTEIIADNMIMLDKKGASGNHQNDQSPHQGLENNQQQNTTNDSEQQPQKDEEEVTIDDLPF
jgi:single-strand DNA-binding protein